MYKKNGKSRVCINFRDLNKATPMDGCPMPIANMSVDVAAGHKVINFLWMAMQNIMAKEDNFQVP